MNPATGGAQCVQHPLQAAVGTCARCGNFMCETCRAGSAQGLCPPCVVLVGGGEFPLTRDNWSFSQLWDIAWTRFQAQWVNLSVASLIVFGASMGVGMVGGVLQAVVGAVGGREAAIAGGALSVVTQLVSTVVQGTLQLGLLRMLLLAIRGQPTDISQVFSGVSLLGRYVLLLLLMLAIFVPVLLLLGGAAFAAAMIAGRGDGGDVAVAVVVALAVPVVMVLLFFVGIPLSFATLELVKNPTAPVTDIVRNCFTIAAQNRWSIFGVQCVEGLVTLAGLLACCVGLVPAAALAQLLHAGLYLALRNGSGLAEPAS